MVKVVKKDVVVFKFFIELFLNGDIVLDFDWLDIKFVMLYVIMIIVCCVIFVCIFLFCKIRKLVIVFVVL